jgi:hypothetical protein
VAIEAKVNLLIFTNPGHVLEVLAAQRFLALPAARNRIGWAHLDVAPSYPVVVERFLREPPQDSLLLL